MAKAIATIDVFYYTGPHTAALLPETDALLARIGADRRDRLSKRIESQRALELAALRMLELAMAARGYTAFKLADVEYRQQNGITEKPFWTKREADFSVSHSRSAAVVAVASHGNVGVDVEYRRTINPSIVRRLVRDDATVLSDLDEVNAVSRWTQIEAVLKGAGIGIMRGREIDWRTDAIVLRDREWYLHAVDCGSNHVAHVAVDQAAAKVNVVKIELL